VYEFAVDDFWGTVFVEVPVSAKVQGLDSDVLSSSSCENDEETLVLIEVFSAESKVLLT